MKWNKFLSAEEISLIATGLTQYKTLATVERITADTPPLFSIDEIEEGVSSYDYNEAEQDKLCESYREAVEINEALEREIYIVDPHNQDVDEEILSSTHLVLSSRGESEEGWIIPKQCLVTRESAALWFYDLDIEKAKLLHPRVESLTTTVDTPVELQNKQESKQQAPIRTSSGTILESLGLMSLILSKEKANFSRGDKPNKKGIAEAVKRKAEELNIDVDQISNLNRDIAAGLRAIELKRNG